MIIWFKNVEINYLINYPPAFIYTEKIITIIQNYKTTDTCKMDHYILYSILINITINLLKCILVVNICNGKIFFIL